MSLVMFTSCKWTVPSSSSLLHLFLCYSLRPKEAFGAWERAKLSDDGGSIHTAQAITQQYECKIKDGTMGKSWMNF